MIQLAHKPGWQETFIQDHGKSISYVGYRRRLLLEDRDELLSATFVDILDSPKLRADMTGWDAGHQVKRIAGNIAQQWNRHRIRARLTSLRLAR